MKAKNILLAAMISLGMVGAGALTATNNKVVETKAATTETARVWFDFPDEYADWSKDGATVNVHYWGGATATNWPGVPTLTDANNSTLRYFDVPIGTTGVVFLRSGPDGSADWGAKTNDLTSVTGFTSYAHKYYKLTSFNWGDTCCPGGWNDMSPATTKKVADFVATMDGVGECCSQEAATTAVTTYNGLATYEQNEFDNYSFGSSTGLDRLNYLRSRYNVSTPLNSTNLFENNKDSTLIIISLVIGLVGTSLIGGYYFVNKKRKAQN